MEKLSHASLTVQLFLLKRGSYIFTLSRCLHCLAISLHNATSGHWLEGLLGCKDTLSAYSHDRFKLLANRRTACHRLYNAFLILLANQPVPPTSRCIKNVDSYRIAFTPNPLSYILRYLSFAMYSSPKRQSRQFRPSELP